MKQSILYVLDYYLPHQGGVETVFEQIITRSLERGERVIVLTSRFDVKLAEREQRGNLEIIRVGKTRLGFMLQALGKGVQILKNNQISFLHTSTYGGAIPASILGFLFGKKVLITVHEVFGKLWWKYKAWYSAWLYLLLEKVIFRLPYAVYHAVSRYTLNCLRVGYGIADEKLVMIHNGVDQEFWSAEGVKKEDKNQISSFFHLQGKWNVLYYGHTGISKGIDYLVEAAEDLLSKYQDLQLIFNFIPAKRGVQVLENLNRILARLPEEMRDRVKVSYGLEKEQLRTLVTCVDGVIAPSLSEGFGSVHTETCEMGTPLITTGVASIPEVVGGKVILCKPASKQALIYAVERLRRADFDDLPVKSFDWRVQFEKIWKLYQQILDDTI